MSSTKKRCANGFRKNKEGVCVKNEKKTAKTTTTTIKRKPKKMSSPVVSAYTPKFHNLASDIFKNYEDLGFISVRKNVDYQKKIHTFVLKNKTKLSIHPGDILFVGSTYEGRQQYGFAIVANDYQVYSNEDAMSLPVRYRKVIPEKLHYQSLIEDMYNRLKKDEEDTVSLNFFGVEEIGQIGVETGGFEEDKEYFQKHGMW
jgi:hypothetical protein